MKGGILFADQVTTVSPTYAREVRTRGARRGTRRRAARGVATSSHGILNGIDAEEWNPATDPLLPANYDADTIARQSEEQARAAEGSGPRSSRAKTPVIGAVSRLVEQKGFQLLIPILDRLLAAGAQVVILGSGEPELEDALEAHRRRSIRSSCRVWIGFDNALAHRIYARRGHAAHAVDLRAVRPQPDVRAALRHGPDRPPDGRSSGHGDPFRWHQPRARRTASGSSRRNPVELYLATWIAMLNFKDPAVWKTLQANGMAVRLLLGPFRAGVRRDLPAGRRGRLTAVAPRMQSEPREERAMIEILVAVAGTLLLIAAGRSRRPVPVPVRTDRPKR